MNENHSGSSGKPTAKTMLWTRRQKVGDYRVEGAVTLYSAGEPQPQRCNFCFHFASEHLKGFSPGTPFITPDCQGNWNNVRGKIMKSNDVHRALYPGIEEKLGCPMCCMCEKCTNRCPCKNGFLGRKRVRGSLDFISQNEYVDNDSNNFLEEGMYNDGQGNI